MQSLEFGLNMSETGGRQTTSPSSKNELLLATERGDDVTVRVLLEAGADVNQQNASGVSALYVAVQTRNRRMARLLLEAGADPDLQDASGWCALHKATMMEGLDTLRLLLSQGARVNAQNHNGVTCLHLCVAKLTEHADVIAWYLLESGADVNLRDKTGNSAFQLSISLNKMALFHAMCEFKPSVRRADARGMLPLHAAALTNNVEVLSVLLQKNSKLEAETRDDQRATALMLATEKRHADAVAQLRAAGASLCAADSRGATPLSVALSHPNDDHALWTSLLQTCSAKEIFQVN